jgi:hypothetical protein
MGSGYSVSRPTWRPSIFFSSDINDAALGGVESCQGRRFWAFISTLDRSPRHYIIERRTKRNAVHLSFVP